MTALATQLARRADDLLRDGEWHNYEEVVRELIKVVPPGLAMRQSEQDRTKNNSRRGHETEPRKRPRPVEKQVYSGARSIVRAFLGNDAFETDKPGSHRGPVPDRQIRQLRQLRWIKGDAYRMQRDQLEYDNLQLHDQVDRLVSWLKDNGHSKVVDELLAGPQPTS